MNPHDSFLRSVGNFFRNPSCPMCAKPLRDFTVDLEGARIRCPQCEGDIDPRAVFRDSELIFLSGAIPPGQREEFLGRLGFEKKPIVRTPKIILASLIIIVTLGTILGALVAFVERHHFGVIMLILLGGGVAVWMTLKYYEGEKAQEWKRRKT